MPGSTPLTCARRAHEGHGRHEAQLRCRSQHRRGRQAVHRDAGADKVEAQLRVRPETAAVAEVTQPRADPDGLRLFQCVEVALELALHRGSSRGVRVGEMRPDRLDLHEAVDHGAQRLLQEPAQLVQRHAVAGQPRVHLDVDAGARARPAAPPRPPRPAPSCSRPTGRCPHARRRRWTDPPATTARRGCVPGRRWPAERAPRTATPRRATRHRIGEPRAPPAPCRARRRRPSRRP